MRSSASWRALLVPAILLLLCACGRTQSDRARPATRLEGTTPAQWRLVWTERPQTEALLCWNTAAEGEHHRVHWDEASHGTDLDAYPHVVECQKNGRYSMAKPELYYHHARLTDLKPSTTYYVVMTSDDSVSRELHFVTAPADDRPFSILQGGDSRSDPDVRRAMNYRMAQLVESDPNILALAHGGDYVYTGLSLERWSHWMSDHEATVTRDGRLLPIIPGRGNHEAFGPLFDEVFGWPGGGQGKNYFATELCPSVLLVTLNTEVATGGRQAAFLTKVLESHDGVRWKVAQYHRPIWPAVKAPSRAKLHWQPVFEQNGMDLVCECDGHVLKRTPPLRGDARDDRHGVVYIGEGGLGVPQRTPDLDRWYLADPGKAMSAYHVWKLSFGHHELGLQAIGADGQVLDSATLEQEE